MNRISIEAATQLNKILSFLSEDVKQNIPQNIWQQINDKTDNNLYTKVNEIKDIKTENILPETRKYLSFVFVNYLASEEEKEEYNKIIKNNEDQYQKILNKKYSVDNLFKKKGILTEVELGYEEEKNILPIERKERFFEFILNKVKGLFRK